MQTIESFGGHGANAASASAGTLAFRVYDPDSRRTVVLHSSIRLSISRALLSALDSMDIEYSVQPMRG